ncbi:MAG: protein kinase [Deltaproteobacteria bacterium]|nr:protein kinase [Deltaproteobacteria bacterium]
MEPVQDPSGWEFAGTERYRLLRRVGEGGMGVVYEVFDKHRQERIALKTLLRANPAALYRFKREFRTLADVSHPNLVTLHELVSEGSDLFFTMELVEGQDLLHYVRPGGPLPRTEAPTLAVPAEKETIRDEDETIAEVDPRAMPPLVEERLRDALRQLAEGLVALHDAGKLHRDVKPSNVLVTREGRVVLLDFGLAADLDEESLVRSQLGMVVGTVAYMAPEQATGEFTTASDWYSVGVILYQALTGHLPFSGSMFKVVLEKQERAPPRADEVVPGLPRDLSDLATALLAPQPRDRPVGREVLRRLGGFVPSRATPALAWAAPELLPRFVGREGHLEALRRAFARAEAGGATVVHVHGTAGIGKTALVRRFVERLPEPRHVFSGRCYEHEIVPYKAFDSVVDALARHLRRRKPEDLQGVLPDDVAALARVFPVLNRVETIHTRSARGQDVPDAIELRRRAFGALRALLTALAREAPVVLFIDDLQWGDADSALLLKAILHPPTPPGLMLVVAYRAEDRDTSELLRTLRTPVDGVELREIIVGPLDHAAAQALARSVLEKDPEASRVNVADAATLRTTVPAMGPPELRAQADAIAREAGGNPLFIFELASFARGGEPRAKGAPDLDEVLARRVARLSTQARQLLEVLAVAGYPLLRAVANRAAGLPLYDHTQANILVNQHLARSRQSNSGDELETYHGRIREAVLERMSQATLRDRHRALAEALGADSGSPQVLRHLEAAGDQDGALDVAQTLARRAADTLALENAATLAKRAVDLSTADHPQYPLRKEYAEALERAGHPGAADAYLAAADVADDRARALEMRRRAAEQLLRFGQVHRGMEILQTVLHAWGMGLPANVERGLAELKVHRSRLLARGLDFKEATLTAQDAARMAQTDACWTAAVGLTMVDTVTASIFITRYLHMALDLGDPNRIARGLAMELAYLASAGKRRPARAARVLQTLRQLAKGIDAPYVRGFAALGAGLAAWHEGAWEQAEQAFSTSRKILETQCVGVDWELSTSRTFALWARALRGEVTEQDQQLDGLVEDALERDSLYAATILRTSPNAQVVWLAADRAEHARAMLEAGELAAAEAAYHLSRYWSMSSRVQLALYARDGAGAWQILTEGWRALAKAGVFRVQIIRWEAVFLRARVALAAAVSSSPHRPLLAAARTDGERLLEAGTPYAAAWGTGIQAQANRALGLQSEAKELFELAARRADAAGMALHAAAYRLRIAQIMGPKAGKPLAAQVLRQMKARGVIRPERYAFFLSPD